MERWKIRRSTSRIQKQLVSSKKAPSDSTAQKLFNNNFKGALSLLTNKEKGRVLALNATTKNDMLSKHPKAEPADPPALITGPLPLQPIFHEKLDGDLIKKCVLTLLTD